jgi:FkbM family methyltransferase
MRSSYKKLIRQVFGEKTAEWLTVLYWRQRNRQRAEYERELRILGRWVRPGDLVVDVGANMGQYSSELSRLVRPGGNVVAFEASPSTARLTARTLAGTGVKLHVCALSDRNGTASLELFADNDGNLIRGHTRLTGAGTPRLAAQSETTETCRLDDVLKDRAQPVRFMKIDVEGHELEVLAGAAQVLGKDRPVLLIEANNAEHFHQLDQTLSALGYAAWRCADETRLEPVKGYVNDCYNYLFLTSEQPAT